MLLKEVAEHLEGRLIGDPSCHIDGVSALSNQREGTLSFILEKKYISDAKDLKAAAFVTFEELPDIQNQIIVKHTRKALANAITLFNGQASGSAIPGRSPQAAIADNASLANSVHVGPFSCIGSFSEIGDNTRIFSQVYIGSNVKIGKNCLFYPQSVIYDNTEIGDNVIIHAGAVIGADGFGYYQDEGKHNKVPHIGKVILEDNVEVGANACIDRGCLDATRIGAGSKIDNLVQIGHNAEIGSGALLVAQVGINGHAKLGNYVTVGGQAGVADVEIGNQVMVAAKAGVTHNITDQSVISGFPAWNHKNELKKEAFIRKLSQKPRKPSGRNENI